MDIIKGLKIGNSEEFYLGEQLKAIRCKLTTADIEISTSTNDNITYIKLDNSLVNLVFDENNKLAGFYSNHVDGTGRVDIGIKMIFEDEVIEGGVGEFCYLTDKVVELSELSADFEEYEVVNFGFMDEYLLQISETGSYEEVISFLRADIAKELGVILTAGDTSINVTDYILA